MEPEYVIQVGHLRVELRRSNSEDWERENPVLMVGEVGFDIDERKMKRGDGSRSWNDLPWWAALVEE